MQQEFSLIKVNPSLIWTNDEKPELFKGQIEVIHKEEANSTTTVKKADKTPIEDDFNFNELDNANNIATVDTLSPTPFNLSKTDVDNDTVIKDGRLNVKFFN